MQGDPGLLHVLVVSPCCLVSLLVLGPVTMQLPGVEVIGGACAAGHVAYDEANDLAHAVSEVVAHVLEDVHIQVAGLQLVREGLALHRLVRPC